ncbi:5-carboxymethyl-2-hydroxymuconate Delta-isomerase [Microvirga rosea]|uniref:5-carboxymethyl-2-hydroxymuconate Delta-isomerase n=1 Tax=Microvirga rosea TaxID=2715425 RepID=UPI001D0B29F7|nr:5-carboxymethyl-2-hydroxymuconate Delta-isomerase [Microvirga rosea]MCB8821125.1 5-carboxymethyl-2-hydroxymuconate Delta-isomerase [Microvirga rosea]
MPQITLEFTENIAKLVDYRSVALGLHDLLVKEISCSLEDCKTRLAAVENYVIGDGSFDEAFVHVTFSILSGRTQAVKESLGTKAVETIARAMPSAVAQRTIQITVEIRDLERSTYKKQVVLGSPARNLA